MGAASLAMGDLVRARRELEEGVREGQISGAIEEVYFCITHLGLVDLEEGRIAEARRSALQSVDHVLAHQGFFTMVMVIPLLTAVFLEADAVWYAREAWKISAHLLALRGWPLRKKFVEAPLQEALDAATELSGPKTMAEIVNAGRDIDPNKKLAELRPELASLVE
jgi:hypothetical protein